MPNDFTVLKDETVRLSLDRAAIMGPCLKERKALLRRAMEKRMAALGKARERSIESETSQPAISDLSIKKRHKDHQSMPSAASRLRTVGSTPKRNIKEGEQKAVGKTAVVDLGARNKHTRGSDHNTSDASDSEGSVSVGEKDRHHDKKNASTKTPIGTLVLKRRTTPVRQAVVKTKHQKWTELIAPAHILHDEVRKVLMETDVTDEERNYLVQWVARVSRRIEKQNKILLENIEIVAEQRATTKQIQRCRDSIRALRKASRRIKREIEQVQQQIQVQQLDDASRRAAEQFLSNLDRLRHS